VEGSKGTLLPELGLAFGLSKIGRTKLRVIRENRELMIEGKYQIVRCPKKIPKFQMKSKTKI
jgi:hypothetical protein